MAKLSIFAEKKDTAPCLQSMRGYGMIVPSERSDPMNEMEQYLEQYLERFEQLMDNSLLTTVIDYGISMLFMIPAFVLMAIALHCMARLAPRPTARLRIISRRALCGSQDL